MTTTTTPSTSSTDAARQQQQQPRQPTIPSSVEAPSSYSPDFKDPTPADFQEIQATHAPLLAASYFLHEHCKPYNDDFMLCKKENGDPAKCALEGRKVTRCAMDLLEKVDAVCKVEFEKQWKCLMQGNNYYWKCRDEERDFNRCVYEKLGYKKVIPGAPDYELPVHMRKDSDRWYK